MANWRDVKARKRGIDDASGRDVATAEAEAKSATAAYVLGYRLSQLREQAHLTQDDVAKRMGVKQPRVSAIEKGDPAQMEVETLRRYIEALGGKLRLVAGFGDHEEIVSTTVVDRTDSDNHATA